MKNIKIKPLLINLGLLSFLGILVYFNFDNVNALMPDFLGKLANYLGIPDTNLSGLAVLALSFVLIGGPYSWMRRVRTTGRVELDDYFEKPEHTNFPVGRMGYSDRLSYTLAELSDLAYWDVFTDEELQNLTLISQSEINDRRKGIVKVAKMLLSNRKEVTKDKFDEVLKRGGFKAINHAIRSDNTECFVCAHHNFSSSKKHHPYIVVAFRGTEVDIDDWLTNIDAVPTTDFETGRVHRGLYKDYKSVQQQVLDAIAQGKRDYGLDTPVFFTGHSRGGALAMIATRLNASDIRGGCYTYGCPRVGDYSFYKGVKTPVFRIVNSSDLVPRVPPGATSYVILAIMKLLSYLTVRFQIVNNLCKAAMGWLDKINDYRHFGDLRYLPDIPSAQINDQSRHMRELQVLSNPDRFDIIQWFFRHVLTSFGAPIESHSMKLYRNKLLSVANNRMQPFETKEKQV